MTLSLFTSKLPVVLRCCLYCLLVLPGCSSAKRPSEKIVQDSGTDTETDTDTGLVWIPGDDFDLTEPFLLSEHKYHRRHHPSFSFDGENIAISWSNGETDFPTLPHFVVLFVFPWDKPWNAGFGTFQEIPPACYLLDCNAPASRPFPTEEGFFLITTGIDMQPPYEPSCQVVLSEWDLGASISYGPQAYYNLYPDEQFLPMSPTGPQDSAGCVTAGNIKCIDCGVSDDLSTSQLAYQVYRYCPGDPPQLVLGQNYAWSDHSLETGHVFSGHGGTNTFEWNGVLTTLAASTGGHLVLAQGTHTGDVVMEPQIVLLPFDAINNHSPQTGYRFYSQHDGSFLVVSRLHYNENPDQEPHPVELVSQVLSMDGQVLSGLKRLVEFDGDEFMYLRTNMAAWNGKYFGVCYREPFDTFKFMLLDENGVLLYDPVSIFPSIPAPEDWESPCDIVAIDEERFAVAMSVRAEGPQDYVNGMYIVYVNINPIE